MNPLPLDILEKIPSLRSRLAYLPFEGGVGGVRIGLRPLEDPWFIFDEDEPVQAEMKRDILREEPREERFGALPDSEAAQHEVHHAIWNWLIETYPDRYEEFAGRIIWAKEFLGDAPLLTISTLVQDDLCLVQKHNDEWIMTAASVCFPTSWRLEEKMGNSVNWIHTNSDDGPIGSEKFRRALDAKVDATTEETTERFNWFIYRDAILRHRHNNRIYDKDWDGEEVTRDNAGDRLNLRYERQTLRRFPDTQSILFTIRPYVDPLSRLKGEHPELIPDFATAYAKHKHLPGVPWKPWQRAMWHYLGPEAWLAIDKLAHPERYSAK